MLKTPKLHLTNDHCAGTGDTEEYNAFKATFLLRVTQLDRGRQGSKWKTTT